MEVIHTYKATTGLGIDELNPRTWRWLPVEFLLRLIAIIHAWERNPVMIKELLHLIVFKAKPEGGFRPIAQMVSLLRVWSKLRHDIAAAWEKQHAAPFFWGVEGKACDRAGWEHNLYEEAAADWTSPQPRSLVTSPNSTTTSATTSFGYKAWPLVFTQGSSCL